MPPTRPTAGGDEADAASFKVFDCETHSHRRFNPLTEKYVLCSPHRSKRPWQGAREAHLKSQLPAYDPRCYLCPGNIRATGDSNPKYEKTFTFLNDYPAVRMEQPMLPLPLTCREDDDTCASSLKNRLFKTQGVRGKCFVLCFSPNHQLTLPQMPVDDIVSVIEAWQKLFKDSQQEAILGSAPFKYLQIFENKGQAMGCSNPHPHGQAWCLDMVPSEISQEFASMQKYYTRHKSHLLGDYVALELAERLRIVCENDSFLVVVPYWALWPFETLLLCKERLSSLMDFLPQHRTDLASILKELTIRYDNLFGVLFPYSMGIHQCPLVCSEAERECWWFHMHFFPPLLRLASVKKFCVGFEMLGEPQRDLTSEQAASRLQDVSGKVHYTEK